MEKFSQILQNSSKEEILEEIENRLKNSDEKEFWKEKVIPFMDAVLSVLIPLREQNLLFNPEGKIKEKLDSELFFRWSDLVCLRILAFILQESNEKNELVRTEYKNINYDLIDLETVAKYLTSNRIDLTDEDNLDFPVATYNLHTGINTIIKNLF
jgi:hypothetical protein